MPSQHEGDDSVFLAFRRNSANFITIATNAAMNVVACNVRRTMSLHVVALLSNRQITLLPAWTNEDIAME